MADQTAGTTPQDANANPPAGARPASSMLMRLTVLLFIVAVIGAECLVASLWLSGGGQASETSTPPPAHEPKDKKDKEKEKQGAQHGKSGHAKEEKPKEKPKHNEETADDSPGQVEVDLEQFAVTAHQPSSNTTMRIEFHLYGIVDSADKEEFEKLLKVNHHRFRELVLVTVRSAEGGDLTDASLGLIKRQILEKTNALLGKPLLRAVIVSDFSYMEQ